MVHGDSLTGNLQKFARTESLRSKAYPLRYDSALLLFAYSQKPRVNIGWAFAYGVERKVL